MKTEAEKLHQQELKKAKKMLDLKTETANDLNVSLTMLLNDLRKRGGEGSDILPDVRVRAGAGNDYIYDVSFTIGWSSRNWLITIISDFIKK